MEEIPRKHDSHEHDNNNNNKSKKALPVALNIRAGGLGIGGIVLVGGALITATIVSAFAFKKRSQRRRSTSENTKKNMSPSQSPETQSLDAPSDEVISMKDIKTKDIQNLTLDENTSILVDSAVKPIDEGSCLERDHGGGGEDQKHLMLIGNENDEQVDTNSSVSDDVLMSVEEYEAIEDGKDHQETVMEDGCVNQVKVEDNLHDEIVLDNCEGDLSDELPGYADQIVHEVVMEEDEASPSMDKETEDEETAQEVEGQVIIEDEAAKVDVADNSSRNLMKEDEITDVKSGEEEQDREEDIIVKVELTSGDASSSIQEEPTQEAKIGDQKTEETSVQVKVEMITDHELVNKDEIPHVESVKEDEDGEEDVTLEADLCSSVGCFSMQEEPTPEAKIGNQKSEETIVQLKVEMITGHELVKIDEIPHVESVKEDGDGEVDVTLEADLCSSVGCLSMLEEPTPEAKIGNQKTEETSAQVKVEMITGHELVKKDEIPHVESIKEDEDFVEDVKVKAKLGSDEPTPEAKIGNKIEDIDAQVKVEMIIDNELAKNDGTPYVKENEDNKEYVTQNANLGSGVSFSAILEEPTPDTKISNHKIEQNMKEDRTILDKNHNDNHDHGATKEKSFASEPWNPKLMALFVLISVCCLVGSLLFIMILLAYRNRTTNMVKF